MKRTYRKYGPAELTRIEWALAWGVAIGFCAGLLVGWWLL